MVSAHPLMHLQAGWFWDTVQPSEHLRAPCLPLGFCSTSSSLAEYLFKYATPSMGSECSVIISVTSSVSWRLKLDSLCHSCDGIRPWPAFQISEKVPGRLGQGTSEIIDERARHWCCHVLSSVRKVECLPHDQLDLTLASGAKIKLKKPINTHLPGTFWRFPHIMLTHLKI